MWIETRAGETTIIACLLTLALVFYYVVIPAGTEAGGGRSLSPRFILHVVVFGTIALCLFRLATLWLRPQSTDEVEYNEHLTDGEKRHYVRFAIILAGCLLYSYVFIGLLGFYASTVLVLLSFALILGERRLPVLILYPVAMTAVLYGLFDIAFNLRLPKGTLIQSLMSS